MKYDLTYEGTKDMFHSYMKVSTCKDGKQLQTNWLWDFEESKLEEAERLNAILPLIKWCADHDWMTEELRGELEWYYDAYTKGNLDGILAEYEADEVIRDLLESYRKVFGDEEDG